MFHFLLPIEVHRLKQEAQNFFFIPVSFLYSSSATAHEGYHEKNHNNSYEGG
jgi:hypothetical protein